MGTQTLRLSILVVGLGGTLCSVSCAADHRGPAQARRRHGAWPQQLLGRTRQMVTDQFAIYASDMAVADALGRWVEEELAAFRVRYSRERTGKGLVFAIEPGEEPVSAIEEWCARNVDRSRVITWSSPIRNQRFQTDGGRPYSLFHRAYFRESFAIPLDTVLAAGGLERIYAQPEWVCFLTTDGHLAGKFDDELRLQKRTAKEELQEVPLMVRIASAPGALILLTAAEALYPKYRAIDLDLMHLQRRETLWRAILGQTVPDRSDRLEHLASLEHQIDCTWRDIWFNRPID